MYGSIAKGTDTAASDIDLMVIADGLDYADVYGALQPAEAALGRTVNPNVMSWTEWRRKRGEAGFVARVAASNSSVRSCGRAVFRRARVARR